MYVSHFSSNAIVVTGAQIDFYDIEEYQANVRKIFNMVSRLDIEAGHEKGDLKIDDTFIDFDKV